MKCWKLIMSTPRPIQRRQGIILTARNFNNILDTELSLPSSSLANIETRELGLEWGSSSCCHRLCSRSNRAKSSRDPNSL